MVFFFFFLFPPPLQPANKSLALLPFFFSCPHCLLTRSLMNTLTLLPSTVVFSYSSWSCVSPPPLPHSSLASPPPRSVSSPRADDRVLESFVSSSPSGQGSRGVHGSSLSLTLLVSSHGDEGAALWAVEEVRGSPGSTHSAAVCLFGVVQFIQVSLSLCQSCLLVPPISSPLIDSSFRPLFVHALPSAFLLFLVLFFLSHLFSFSLPSSQSRDKVR